MAPPALLDGGADDGIHAFTEPNVDLSLAARDETTASIRVHLNFEARPPWLAGVDHGGLYEYFMR